MAEPTTAEWDAAIEEFRNRERWAVLRPACAPIVPVLERLRCDPRVGSVRLQVSHATLVVGVLGNEHRVGRIGR